jgi:hypothetical protein
MQVILNMPVYNLLKTIRGDLSNLIFEERVKVFIIKTNRLSYDSTSKYNETRTAYRPHYTHSSESKVFHDDTKKHFPAPEI